MTYITISTDLWTFFGDLTVGPTLARIPCFMPTATPRSCTRPSCLTGGEAELGRLLPRGRCRSSGTERPSSSAQLPWGREDASIQEGEPGTPCRGSNGGRQEPVSDLPQPQPIQQRERERVCFQKKKKGGGAWTAPLDFRRHFLL